MGIGDIVEVNAKYMFGSVSFIGMVGAIIQDDIYVFNNKRPGDLPPGISPNDFGYKYSWKLSNGSEFRITKYHETADEYNKSCHNKPMPF